MAKIERMENTGRMSRIVTYGDMVYLSGLTGNPDHTDVGTQTQDVLDAIDEKLAKAGSDKHHILQATIWISDMRFFEDMNAVWDAWVSKENAPARATVEARLARPSLLVEIGIVATKAG